MKRIIFLLTFFSILSTSSYAQWWVDGGNLLWPYGDVSIMKNLNVNGTVNGAKSYLFLFTHDGGTGNPTVVDLFNNIGSHASWVRTGVGVFRTTFTGLTFDNNKVFNTRSVTIDNGDTKIHYVTYTSGSYLYLQITDFETISEYEPMLTRLPVSLIYYP
jgi:hypothetical protein